jgi:hypothetical protein
MKFTSLLVLYASLGLTSIAQAGELGRLFFSPEERQQLDRQHAKNTLGEDAANTPTGITVNGIIQHSDGSRTAWINGKMQNNVPGKSLNAVPVTLPGKSESIEVKVGQRLLIDDIPSKIEIPATSKKDD